MTCQKTIVLVALMLLASAVCSAAANTSHALNLVAQRGHSNTVGCLAFSPDGRFLVTGDRVANVLILWEVTSGLELRRFVGHQGRILAVAFSHDGNRIASLGSDRTIRTWDALTGSGIRTINFSGMP